MDFHQWQNQLLNELRARKVQPSYVRRLLAELQDHYFDLQEVEMNDSKDTDTPVDFSVRMGDPKQLAERAAETGFYPNWIGRHPWLTFVAATPVLFSIGVVSFTWLIIKLDFLVAGQTVETTPALAQICQWVGWTIAVIPAVAVSLLLCWMVATSGRRRLWAMAACSLVALLAANMAVSCIPPQSELRTGYLSIGLGISHFSQIWQAIAPLLVGCLFMAAGQLADKIEQQTSWESMGRAA